jgi:hypothetical protein
MDNVYVCSQHEIRAASSPSLRFYFAVKLLTFCTRCCSIYFTFTALYSNFSCVKAQVSVLVMLRTYVELLSNFFNMWNMLVSLLLYPFFTKCSNRVVWKLSCCMKRCCTAINTYLFELIQWADEESFSLYRQIATVKHPQPLIDVNYNSDKSKSIVVYVRVCCFWWCWSFQLRVFSSLTCLSDILFLHFYLRYFLWHRWNYKCW